MQRYDGSQGVPRSLVSRRRLAVGVLQWKSDRELELYYTKNKGNVGGMRWCTGTLIDEAIFLTAAHCVNNENSGWLVKPHGEHAPLDPHDMAQLFRVQFHYEHAGEGSKMDPQEPYYDVVELMEYLEGDLDYAILRLGPDPDGVSPAARHAVARVSEDVRVKDPIAILQHPAGETMKVGAGPVAAVSGSDLSYQIDTKGGSSGAGIWNGRTGKLVGIHTRGSCGTTGEYNYGISVRALAKVSPTIGRLIDNTPDFLVVDWDHDGVSDLATHENGCVYIDGNHDSQFDTVWYCPDDGGRAEQLLVGNFGPDRSSIAWTSDRCVHFDSDPGRPICYAERDRVFDFVAADWDGDGITDIGIQRGGMLWFDLNRDGVLDTPVYQYGDGLGEDQYLVGKWHGGSTDQFAVRRGNTVSMDTNRDGVYDDYRMVGAGGLEDQYLSGHWRADALSGLVCRQGHVFTEE